MSRHLDSSTTTQMAKIMVQYRRPSCSSWTDSIWSSFGRTIMGKAIWENSIKARFGESLKKLGMSIRTPSKRNILICVCGWHKNWMERNKILIRCGKYSTKKSIWENQHLSWIMKTWEEECIQRQCEISKDMVDNNRTMFESRISAGGTEKLPFSENLRFFSWSYDMEGHAMKCVERYCELANKTTQQLKKVSTPCIDDHHFKRRRIEIRGRTVKSILSNCSECLYLALIGRPDIVWPVNKFARSIKKWTKACDKRLNRLISYIRHTCEYKQYGYVGNTAKQCRLGLFQDSDFAGDLEDSKSTSGGTLCVFRSHTFSNKLDV